MASGEKCNGFREKSYSDGLVLRQYARAIRRWHCGRGDGEIRYGFGGGGVELSLHDLLSLLRFRGVDDLQVIESGGLWFDLDS